MPASVRFLGCSDFCRYADDIFVFCDNEKQALITIYQMTAFTPVPNNSVIRKHFRHSPHLHHPAENAGVSCPQ